MTNSPRSILIINQQWSNHGDEAAHKGLVRMLRKRFPAASISVLVFSKKVSDLDMQLFPPDDVGDLEYFHLKKPPPGRRLRWASKLPVGRAKILLSSPRFRRIARRMSCTDLIVSAPSGVDLGPYRHWRYLALLLLALESGTPTAVYAISFGPLPGDDPADVRFSALTVDVLKRLDFLSLRETTSQRYAEQRGIAYVPATDTAFLDATRRPIPESFRAKLTPRFVVIVPNELDRWHGRYPAVGAQPLENLYTTLIETALKMTSQVVLMPQLFGRQNDADYCQRLRSRFGPGDQERILILPEHLPCEVQKTLVGEAEMLVGGRSHSVVFSLHNDTAFLALSYEHKIRALVEQAGLSDCMVDIEDPASLDAQAVARLFVDIYGRRAEVRREVARKAAAIRAIAERAADTFAERFGAGT